MQSIDSFQLSPTAWLMKHFDPMFWRVREGSSGLGMVPSDSPPNPMGFFPLAPRRHLPQRRVTQQDHFPFRSVHPPDHSGTHPDAQLGKNDSYCSRASASLSG